MEDLLQKWKNLLEEEGDNAEDPGEAENAEDSDHKNYNYNYKNYNNHNYKNYLTMICMRFVFMLLQNFHEWIPENFVLNIMRRN